MMRGRRADGLGLAPALLLLLLLLLCGGAVAQAHPIAPSTLHVDESAPGVAHARLRTPTAAHLVPHWPSSCVASPTAPASDLDDFTTAHFALDCHGRALAGLGLGVDGLRDTDSIAIVRVRLHDGRVLRELLGPAHPRFTIPGPAPWTHDLASQLGRGMVQLFTSPAHLLLLLGLLLVVSASSGRAGARVRVRIAALAAFTLGHSASFALATAAGVHISTTTATSLAAVALLVVALRALSTTTTATITTASAAAGIAASTSIGVLHGLGFTTASPGPGPAHRVLALVSFDLGVQLGALVVVGACVLVTRLATPALRRLPGVAPRLRPTLAYGLGALAAMWCLQGTLTWLS